MCDSRTSAVVRFLFSLLNCLATAGAVGGDEFKVSSPIAIANGTLVIVHSPRRPSREILIHFHGAAKLVQEAFVRSGQAGTLAIVNFPGLSSAYSKPFAENSRLLNSILEQTASHVIKEGDSSWDGRWEKLTLSSFSAGYGAIREILKSPEDFERIQAIITADSIYAGLVPHQTGGQVDPVSMQEFLRFATLAAKGKKVFVISHSAQPTPYASTTQTAEYLLQELDIKRTSDASLKLNSLAQTSRAELGGFVVLGFEGTSGPDHMQHLHRIDLFWKESLLRWK